MLLKRVILIIFALATVICCRAEAVVVSPGEKIVFAVSPMGKAEYTDMGIVEYKGKRLWLVTFQTRLPGFNDLEKIYADPSTGFPLLVERYIHWPFSYEYLTEDYDPVNYSQVIKRYLKNKLTNEYKFKNHGPFQNAILMPFYLRGVEGLKIGWKIEVRIPQKFMVTLSEIKEVQVGKKKIMAFHFTSEPNKFDIWISMDKHRLPLVIKGLSYGMIMQSHKPAKEGIKTGGKI